MSKEMNFDVTVIGGGPAGLAAALEAHKAGGEVVLVERENRLGEYSSSVYTTALVLCVIRKSLRDLSMHSGL